MSEFEYASAPESKAIAKIAASYDLFIGGKFAVSYTHLTLPTNREV